MLRLLVNIVIPLVIAIAGGTASAWYAVNHVSGLDSARYNEWVTHPAAGTLAADPYSRAQIAREGLIPLGAAEGLPFIATRDRAGQLLSFGCSYRLEGATPASRLWTLYALDRNDKMAFHPARPFPATHSRQIIRSGDGSFVIEIGKRAAPGNWLAVNGEGDFRLILTLYDSPVANRSNITQLTMPQIHRISCD